MGIRGIGAALALVVVMTGCSDDGSEERPSGTAPGTSTSSAPAPGPDIEAQLERLAEDALRIDPRAEVVEPTGDLEVDVANMYWEHSQESGYGDMFMQPALTVSYPGLDGIRHARDFLRLFKKHGFGTAVGYTTDDIVHGSVQRSTDLRCRALLERDSARLVCIPNEFFAFMEWDVVTAITDRYADEVSSVDIGGWEIFYPQGYDAQPPVGAILRTNVESDRLELRAYVGTPEAGWRRVARATSFRDLGIAIGRRVCRTKLRPAFELLCPGAAT